MNKKKTTNERDELQRKLASSFNDTRTSVSLKPKTMKPGGTSKTSTMLFYSADLDKLDATADFIKQHAGLRGITDSALARILIRGCKLDDELLPVVEAVLGEDGRRK
jgi:hypothetical protein